VEVLHNFTLVHDDMMDSAASRRGRPTVHTKWNPRTALLVGDVLVGFAYRSLLGGSASRHRKGIDLRRICTLFTSGFIEVCEGQALDLELERKKRVSLGNYFGMIEKKTGRMISMSTELGGLIGNGTDRQVRALRRFGHYLGSAFQLQDDLLDVVADEKDFGKTIGGDIIAGKKTFLLLKAAERASGRDRSLLRKIMEHGDRSQGGAVARVTALYRKYGVLDEARERISAHTAQATAALAALPAGPAADMLHRLAGSLLRRVS
jgi:geranylgeranyl diphosphate synthase type II